MRGASIGIFIILVVIGTVISGCTGKNEASSAYAENQNGVPSDPHVEEATFGGYNIKGDEKGLGFYIEQKNHKISPGAPVAKDGVMDVTNGVGVEMAGAIDVSNGAGLVYANMNALQDMHLSVIKNGGETKGGETIQKDLSEYGMRPDVEEVKEKPGLWVFGLDIVRLKNENNLKQGDLIEVYNIGNGKDMIIDFVVQ